LREAIVENGGPLPKPLGKIEGNIENHHNIFGPVKRPNPLEGIPAEGEDIYFSGCYATYVLPETAKATSAVLKAAGIHIANLGEAERCCGEMLRQIGNLKLFKEQAVYNIEAMKKAGAKRVILSCAHCYRTWKIDYPTVAGELPFEVIHVSELFEKLHEEGRIKFSKRIEKKVTYHDPCFLGRFGGQVYDAPRKILTSIPGIELKEMERYGKWAYCCGAGGKITLNCYPKFAGAIGKDRVSEAKKVADYLATACPVCLNHMKKTAEKENMELQVLELSMMVAEAMGVLPD
jgi:heterodisulfide reductase subunit D